MKEVKNKKDLIFLKSISRKASDRLWGNYSMGLVYTLINVKVWSNFMSNTGLKI